MTLTWNRKAYQTSLVAWLRLVKFLYLWVDEAVSRMLENEIFTRCFDDPIAIQMKKREKELTYTKDHRMAARDV